MRKQMAGVLCGLLMAAAGVMTVQADDWMLSDNGKHWMYMQSPDEPVKDEWIEDGDKLYYVDSKGYMKTGWVTNKDDGEKYYMGPDGAMAFNTFATDGRYVGPDGTGVEEYDKYRKAIKAELKSSSKTKKSKNNKKKNKEKCGVSSPDSAVFPCGRSEPRRISGSGGDVRGTGAGQPSESCPVGSGGKKDAAGSGV